MFPVLRAAGECILGGVVHDGACGGTIPAGNPEEGGPPHDAPGPRDIRDGPSGSTKDHLLILSPPQTGMRAVQRHDFVTHFPLPLRAKRRTRHTQEPLFRAASGSTF